jgi:hypothetical protein
LQNKEKDFMAGSEVQRLTNFLVFLITSSHSGGNDISRPIMLNEFKVFAGKADNPAPLNRFIYLVY